MKKGKADKVPFSSNIMRSFFKSFLDTIGKEYISINSDERDRIINMYDNFTLERKREVVDELSTVLNHIRGNKSITSEDIFNLFSTNSKLKFIFDSYGKEEVTNKYGNDYQGSLDIVDLYMYEVGQTKLLTHEEEIKLAKRIEQGDKEAKDLFISSNLKLVVSIARSHIGYGLEFNDLIQEGNIGLMRAVDRYDYRKGYKFSTYATWWIRQGIVRSLADKGKLIRIPVHVVEDIKKMNNVKRSFTDNNKDISTKEISEATGFSVEKVRDLEVIDQQVLSLNVLLGEDKESTLEDFICDLNAISPEKYAIDQVLKDNLMLALDTLTEREKNVLIFRFGLNGSEEMTLDEVGEFYNITKERVRQIEKKALEKLRLPSRLNFFTDSEEKFKLIFNKRKEK